MLPVIELLSRHHQNASIHSLTSIGSIVEPVTPPDLGDHFGTPSLNQFSTNSAGSNGASSTTTPLSTLNTNIGGNTFRSRLRSLPLVNELDYKFNQFNISSLQNLSQGSPGTAYIPSPSQSVSSSSSSIPQIPLSSLSSQSHTALDTPQVRKVSPPVPQHESSRSQAQFQPRLSLPNVHSLGSNKRDGSFSSSSNSNYKNFDELNLIPFEDLDILKLSVDQYGCRYLQKKLDADNGVKDIIFKKVFNNLIELIIDPFGNYLVQKLVEYLSSYQKDLLVEKTHTYLFLVAVNQYGTRSLQKIIDKVDTVYQMDLIIKGLQMNDTSNGIEDNNIVKLIKDLNGNHVVQKCIFRFPPEKFQFIIDSICINDNIVRISTHKHGCCVLQKLLNTANFEQIVKISKILLVYLDDLINDQFGNYIIQFLFELNFLKDSTDLDFLVVSFFAKIYPKLIRLSCLKFSSNVIEKYIKVLKAKQNYEYLNEIIKLINVNFEMLIKDKFGNYVIQTMIDQFYDVHELNLEMNILITTVKNYLPVIKAAPYARKIQLKIQQLETNYTFNQHELTRVAQNLPTGKYYDVSQMTYNNGPNSFTHEGNSYTNYMNGGGPPQGFNPYYSMDASFYRSSGNLTSVNNLVMPNDYRNFNDSNNGKNLSDTQNSSNNLYQL
ncbi:Suppressor protein MPT5 AltName: Full=Protein HTR1 [Cyberlindnera jadinii]|uniref:PUM-HD domain-containing protein n=1 Tax=Cyberlindnera jadinii (strain ATCC 18201 / CBS 1600 / BCRC 20928 / JCM 3617 / NBRC 0987 / NRRL Y-1542) TaxID=983966 RepID=A0A0H5CAE0_CYBJN|nr:Suppressor protein MPT5 AltName: Full=Protein HTR1 [Cyberlindnera jadinii]